MLRMFIQNSFLWIMLERSKLVTKLHILLLFKAMYKLHKIHHSKKILEKLLYNLYKNIY